MQPENYFKKYIASTLFALALLGGAFLSGKYVGSRATSTFQVPAWIENAEKEKPDGVDFSSFWKVWNTLNEKYVDSATSTEKTVSNEEKVWGAIQGLVASLDDPYTVFFPPAESKIFRDEVNGNFSGIGIEMGVKDGALTVIAPLKNTPAYRAGLLAGDKIVEIDGRSSSEIGVDEAVKKIRGEVGTTVTLTIDRITEDELLKIKIVRDLIDIPTIDTELLPQDVFVIRLYNFSAVSPDLFRQALREFIRSGTNKLILDLRGNPGGYLEAAIDMASWFLPAGEVIVSEDYGDSSRGQVFRSKGYDIFNDTLKFAILLDGGSASASEILAGALREHGVATLVGEKTFGKGSVQELVSVTSDTSLKVTVAHWLTPNGVSISETGVTPDIIVSLKPTELKDSQKDSQQKAAVEFLLKK